MELEQIKTSEHYIGFAESRIGGRSENQDSYGYADTPHGLLVTVCDGMGGGPAGKTASSVAVKQIISYVMDFKENEKPTNIIIKAIRKANMCIYEMGLENPALMGMGSTCTVLLLQSKGATVAHVGDSRVYQLRGNQKIFRTFDHSMVFDLVKQKVITEEQARLSAQSNIVTRVLGVKPDVEVDCSELPYEKGDLFLLCTDGIHGTVSEKELIKWASDGKTPLGTVVDNIATKIDGIGRGSGESYDNLTLAMVKTEKNSDNMEIIKKRLIQISAILLLLLVISIGFNIKGCSDKTESVTEVGNDSTCYILEVKKVLEQHVSDSLIVEKVISELNQKEESKK